MCIEKEVFFRKCFINKFHISLYNRCGREGKISRRDARRVISFVRLNKQEMNELMDILVQYRCIEKDGQEYLVVNPPRIEDDVGCWVGMKKQKIPTKSEILIQNL